MLTTLLILAYGGRGSALEYHIQGGAGIVHHPAGGAVIFKHFVHMFTVTIFFGNRANV